MFRLTRKYTTCRKRIDDLERILMPAERFVLVFAFVEKHLRRVFVHMLKARGITDENALKESRQASGIVGLNGKWKSFDPMNRTLTNLLGEDWKVLHRCAELRNQLIHGSGHKDHRIYGKEIPNLLHALDNARKVFALEYGFAGWQNRRRKK